MKKIKTWENLIFIINNNLFNQLNRNEFQNNRYFIHKYLLKKNNIHIKDFIINKYFKNNNNYILTNNDFPYNVSKNILHLIFWIKKNDLINNLKNIIKNEIIKKFKKEYEFIFFENPNNLKSIPEIKHYHIFLKLY